MLGRIAGMMVGVGFALSCWAPLQAKELWLNSFEEPLYYGQTAEAVAIAAGRVATGPNDRLPRFAHGIALFLDAVRRFGKDMYRYDITPDCGDSGLGAAPFLPRPVPPVVDSETIY